MKDIITSFTFRLKLVFRIIFCLDRNLPWDMFCKKTNTVDIRSNADFTSIIGITNDFTFRDNKLFREFYDNPESIEIDVAKLLHFIITNNSASVAIEVGIYKGAGSLTLARAISKQAGGVLHLVDLSPDYMRRVKRKIDSAHYPIKLFTHVGLSHIVANEIEDEIADFIFIDADHSFDSVSRDFEAYWKKLKVGGIMSLHDTVMWDGSRNFANKLFSDEYSIITLSTSGGSGLSIVRKTR